MKSILLFGMKHVGKSTLGRLLAKHLSLSFEDLDHVLCKLARPDIPGFTPRILYQEEGANGFASWEAKAAHFLAPRLSRGMVLALGGGTLSNEEAWYALKPMGIGIHLKEQASVLFERIKKGGIPPFLDADHPWKSFVKLYEKRTEQMENAATISVDLGGKNIDGALESVLQALEENGYAR